MSKPSARWLSPSCCSWPSSARGASCINTAIDNLQSNSRPRAIPSAAGSFIPIPPKSSRESAYLPQRLLTLYEDHATILAEQVEIRRPTPNPENPLEPQNPAEWIEAFLPLDLESQKYAINLRAQGWGKGFCFATDGEGNFYWIPANDSRLPDAPVFFAHTDPVLNEQVAASLEELLSWPRILHTPEPEQPQ